ncbi:MAG: SH3 domain-containing protein [Chloroflexi bacterium]|nr:SH3 domain-containing protein [Chloroflexota bacterium]
MRSAARWQRRPRESFEGPCGRSNLIKRWSTKRYGVPLLILLFSSALLACQITNLAAALTSASPTATARPTLVRESATPTAMVIQVETPVPTLVEESPTPAEVFATTTDNLRIRGEPSTSAAVIGRLTQGTRVHVLGRTAANDWLEIASPTNPNTLGWIAAQYTQIDGPLDALAVSQPGGGAVAPTRVQAQPARPTNPPPAQPTSPRPPTPRPYPYP